MLWTCSLALLLLQIFSIRGVSADCYNWDGKLALDTEVYTGGTELVSCGKNTNNCCLRGEECGSNLLCKSIDGYLKRQYCADVFWKNCSTLALNYKNGGVVLNDCGDNVVNFGSGNCTTGPFYFVNPTNGNVVTQSISSGTTATASYWSVDTAAVLASQSAASLTSSIPATASVQTTSTSNGPSATASSSVPSQTSSPSSSSGLSAGASAGIGVGAAVVVCVLAGLGWLWMRERKKRRALLYQNQQPYVPQTSKPAYPSYPQNEPHKVVYAQHHEPAPQYPPQELASEGPRNEAP